ncbi:hypothetical protein ACUTJJ_11470 [Agrobacterium sp. DKPNP3]|uniref:hypothetical protein n=1 Tax=Agrobacterium sp. DKPNP3 TaxID=3457323 RepID=UPI004043E4A6
MDVNIDSVRNVDLTIEKRLQVSRMDIVDSGRRRRFCVSVSEQTLSREVRAMFDYIEIFCTPTRKHVRSGMLSPAATD